MADSGPAGGAALAAPAPGPGSGSTGPRVYFQSPPGAAGEGPGGADDDGPVRRQGKVTVKYDRKELRKRLNLEEWILEQLTRLYDCQVCSPPRADALKSDPSRSARKPHRRSVVSRWERGCSLLHQPLPSVWFSLPDLSHYLSPLPRTLRPSWYCPRLDMVSSPSLEGWIARSGTGSRLAWADSERSNLVSLVWARIDTS